MEDAKTNSLLSLGALLAAIGASLCCILPVAVAVLGVGSAAMAARFEPFRPYMIGFTALFLGFGFYRAYRPVPCEPGEACAIPAYRRRQRIVLWIVTLLAILLMAFPYYSTWLV